MTGVWACPLAQSHICWPNLVAASPGAASRERRPGGEDAAPERGIRAALWQPSAHHESP
jgi:hypothetical protein